MTSHAPDPRAVQALAGEVALLHQRLGRVAHDLARLAPSPPPQPVPPVQPAVPVPPVRPHPAGPPQYRPPTPPRSAPPASPASTVPWWQRDGVVSRLLAIAGAAVTLVGVVMLVVLAARAGWFGPPLRVAAGVAVSVGLLGAAFRVVDRPGGRIGAVASAAAGFAGLYLSVAAVTALYGWVAAPVGIVLGLGVAALGVAVALRWSSELLAVLVVLGVALLAPVVTGGLSAALLVALVVVHLATVPVDATRSWTVLRAVRTAPVVLALAAAAATVAMGAEAPRVPVLLVALAAFGGAVASARLVLRRVPTDATTLAAVVSTAGTLLAAACLLDRPVTTAVAAGVALTTGYFLLQGDRPSSTRFAFALPTALAATVAVVAATPGDLAFPALMAVACVTMIAAHRVGSLPLFGVGVALSAVGVAGYADAWSLDATISPTLATTLGGWALVGAVAAVATAVTGSVVGLRVLRDDAVRVIVAGCFAVVGLAAAVTTTVVSGALLAGRAGAVAGHGVGTVLWTGLAVALLARGLARPTHARTLLAAGLAVAGAALAKLFLFDLAATGGVTRAVAFLLVGGLLLAAGTRYARVFAERLGASPTDGAIDATAAADAPAARSH
ncbi:DUF2339 domain-containing protein [Rhodococcoides corynebacterioides]|uniref:DUF2339 domain-containing protein n=1 Tax=Rhodococcoides corynebacterioides TaxID=53972 RepID=UPI003AE44DE6